MARSITCSWDIYRQRLLSSSVLSVASLLLSLFPVRGALFIGRASQPWPTVWNIFFAGLIGCRWRSPITGTRQQSEQSPLLPTCPPTDEEENPVHQAGNTQRRA